MPKNLDLVFDVLCYFIFPILCWEVGRVYLSDYIALLISSFPGIVYSLYRYLETSSLSVTRVFLLLNIIIGLFIDLFSGTAPRLLWNDAYYSLGLSLFYLGSCFFFKPLIFYIALDLLVLQGYDRKLTREVLLSKEALTVLRWITLLNSLREFMYAFFLIKTLPEHGVEIYTLSVFLDQLFSFLISGISLIGFYYLYRLLNEIVTVHKYAARKRSFKLRGRHYYISFEGSYFFLRKHFF